MARPKMKDRRSLQERNHLVEANVGLVWRVVLRLWNIHSPIRFRLKEVDEAVAIGYQALIRAAGCFDERKGFKFSTYATSAIVRTLIDTSKKCSTIRVPRNYTETVFQEHGEKALLCTAIGGIDFDSRLDESDGREEDKVSEWVSVEDLVKGIAFLAPQERDVLIRYFWHQEKLGDIGKDYDLTRSRIQQIKEEAVVHLKQILTARCNRRLIGQR